MSDHVPGASLQIINRDAARLAERHLITKKVGGLWHLVTEVLGYTRLTEEFHRPICDEMDRDRLGLSEGKKFYRDSSRQLLRVLDIWPRGTYKTTIEIGQAIQAHLADIETRIAVIHAKLDQSKGIVKEAGIHWIGNKKLRKLTTRSEGYAPPPSRAKPGRWLKEGIFTFEGCDQGERSGSFQAWSTGADMTGYHFQIALPDDIISQGVIDDSGLPKVRSWYGGSLTKALDRGYPMWAKGTPWDPDDIYTTWGEDSSWKVRHHSIRETDGEMDYKGEVIYYDSRKTRAQLEAEVKQDEKDDPTNFAFQMMCDKSPKGEKKWDASNCEHRVTLKETARHRGSIFVLGDPAPAKTGSYKGIKEKQRGDGSKDRWAWSVIRRQVNGESLEKVLIDGSSSRTWATSEGFDEGARLGKKWGTTLYGVEDYGGLTADYEEQMRAAVRRMGGRGCRYIPLRGNQANRKNHAFAALAGEASEQRFLIADSVPPEYLERFLEQVRNWRDLPGGRNTNKHDDEADITARSCDATLSEFTPSAFFIRTPYDELEDEEEEDYVVVAPVAGVAY